MIITDFKSGVACGNEVEKLSNGNYRIHMDVEERHATGFDLELTLTPGEFKRLIENMLEAL